MVIVLLGPAGAGKDTQATLLAKRLNLPSISTGQLCRDAIKEGDILGRFIDRYTSHGKLIPTELVLELLFDRVEREDAKNGFIVNGAPRTFEQIALIDNAARHIGEKITFVFSLEVPVIETIARLQKRAGVENRADDKDLKFILERLTSHYHDSDDIKNEYRDRGVLYEVDGRSHVEDIQNEILRIIKTKVDLD